MPPVAPLNIRYRVLIALAIGAASMAICYLLLTFSTEENWAGDFSWAYRGAEYLLAGENPYDGEYPRTDPLFYPLPALFIAIPFTPFPPEMAGALFVGISSGLLAFAVTRYGGVYLPLFISAPFFMTLITAQWAPLLLAGVFLPWLGPALIAKPSLGAAVLLTWPNLRVIAAMAVVTLLSLILQPTWPLDWYESLRATSHPSAIFLLPGPIILLALLCWRRQDGRFLLLMGLIPQRLFFYDQLLLWLVVRTPMQSLVFALVSWLGLVGWAVTVPVDDVAGAAIWVVASMFIPATVILLWNARGDGSTRVPAVIEWLRQRFP